MLVTVTQAHIDNGSRSSTDCPIALAILERLPHLACVEVDSNGVELICLNDDDIVCALPDEALRFINRFDFGAEVAPFEFSLHIPRFDWESL